MPKHFSDECVADFNCPSSLVRDGAHGTNSAALHFGHMKTRMTSLASSFRGLQKRDEMRLILELEVAFPCEVQKTLRPEHHEDRLVKNVMS